MRIEGHPAALTEPEHQVIHRRVAPRMPAWLAPQVDEHVVAVQIAVLAVHVVGVEPDQLDADRDRARFARFGTGAVVIRPRCDRHLPLWRLPVLVA